MTLTENQENEQQNLEIFQWSTRPRLMFEIKNNVFLGALLRASMGGKYVATLVLRNTAASYRTRFSLLN